MHLLGVEHLPQLLGNFLVLALLPLGGDFVKFVLAGLDFILQFFKPANPNTRAMPAQLPTAQAGPPDCKTGLGTKLYLQVRPPKTKPG